MPAFIGLGSNEGNPADNLRRAVTLIKEIPGVLVSATSSLYRTRPWGDEEQAEFTNAVTGLDTTLQPGDLLEALSGIEIRMGRVRSERRWGPRLIDLDLLVYDDVVLATETLVLPHPRMHERAFVLEPLAEIAPGLKIPGKGSVTGLLAGLEGQGVERLEAGI